MGSYLLVEIGPRSLMAAVLTTPVRCIMPLSRILFSLSYVCITMYVSSSSSSCPSILLSIVVSLNKLPENRCWNRTRCYRRGRLTLNHLPNAENQGRGRRALAPLVLTTWDILHRVCRHRKLSRRDPPCRVCVSRMLHVLTSTMSGVVHVLKSGQAASALGGL